MKNPETITQKLKKNKAVYVIILISFLLGLFWLVQHREPKKVMQERVSERIPVSVALVSKAAVRDSFSTVGTVEAFREADIFSESAGLVRRVSAEPGASKKAGEALFILDDELATARQRKADAHFRQSKRDEERYKNLYNEGAVALSAYEGIQLQREEAEAEFVAASRKYRDTKVKAPFSGIVTARFVEQGELVQEGKKVAQMVDMSKVKVIIFVPEREIVKFAPGILLAVTSDLYPGETFSGKVSSVSDKAGRDHTFRVEVVLQNSGKSVFRSGMFARVLLKGEGEREALLVPRVALVSGIRKPELFVIRNGKAFLKSFVAGMEMQKYLEVLGGLSPGESVVISGQNELNDGSDVVVINQKKNPSAP
ncbi:MAG: efflux RND transporter periplasmic adaptor subunit [Chlorobiaceae bacterium]|jgi:RND family efflux transporter MFP subunit|nr:efflux RND transporter periplasmic adaptor subunit [Chlorobiaceae bacterium]NTV16992.1 efflux RND transporter periplasmic adaptor subunit [Chlorobiaceae bacterium]